MVTPIARFVLSAILLAALPAKGWAQDAKAVVGTAAHTMGTENLRTLQYSASGSAYDDKGQYSQIKSYRRTMDFNATTANGTTVRSTGTPASEQTTTEAINSSSPWSSQMSFWLTPFGFLKGAELNTPTLETKSLYGQSYRVVSYTLPGNHKVSGYINGKDLVERVQVTGDNNASIEAVFHSYEDFGGLKVPTIMIQNVGGNVTQILVVKEAKPNA